MAAVVWPAPGVACTQHVGPYAARMAEVLRDPSLQPIATELGQVCAALEAEKRAQRYYKI